MYYFTAGHVYQQVPHATYHVTNVFLLYRKEYNPVYVYISLYGCHIYIWLNKGVEEGFYGLLGLVTHLKELSESIFRALKGS